MAITVRNAGQADIEHLVRIRMLAHGGFNEALYENLDRPVEAIVASELDDPATSEHYRNYRVADVDGGIAGGVAAFPYDDANPESDHPLLPPERLYLEAPFDAIEAPGTFYIHALTVFPEFTRRGIGSVLLDAARAQAVDAGFDRLSLFVFAENHGAIALYRKHGFSVAGRSPLIPHPKFVYSGDILLMICPHREQA